MHFLESYSCRLCRCLLVGSRCVRRNPGRTTIELCRADRRNGLALFSSALDIIGNQATVFALSSGHGKCGVAVIRLTGPASCDVVMRMAKLRSPPKSRHAVLRHIVDPATDDAIDKGLVLWFPGPKSFTGEDSAEFHVHGGPSVVAAMLTALGAMPGLRHAQPGEFTKRAFENGKLDLTEVEGLADLIHAQTEAQRRQALRQMDGHLSALYQGWRTRLLKCLANAEAYIDFGEDEGIEDDIMQQVQEEVRALSGEIERHLLDNRRGERLRSGVRVAILGRPNVGKSSLLNQMCQRPAAIVSPVPGTTRDVVESTVDIGGYPVLFSDTAGLRETEDVVEKEGVRRALLRAEEADVRVIVLDAPSQLKPEMLEKGIYDILESELQELGLSPHAHHSSSSTNPESPPASHALPSQKDTRLDSQTVQHASLHSQASAPLDSRTHAPSDRDQPKISVESSTPKGSGKEGEGRRRHDEDRVRDEVREGEELEERIPDSAAGEAETLVVFNKLDLLGQAWQGPLTGCAGGFHWSCMSCASGQGVPEFSQLLASRVKDVCGDPSEGSPSLTAARHRTLLTQCLGSLEQFWEVEEDCVLAAEHLRRAASSLGKVIGHISTEDILDVIFRDFCIGK